VLRRDVDAADFVDAPALACRAAIEPVGGVPPGTPPRQADQPARPAIGLAEEAVAAP